MITGEILEDLIKKRLSVYELKVILAIIRKTDGWNKKWDTISFSQFTKMTGICKENLSKTIKKLLDKHLIEREPSGKSYKYRYLSSGSIPQKNRHKAETAHQEMMHKWHQFWETYNHKNNQEVAFQAFEQHWEEKIKPNWEIVLWAANIEATKVRPIKSKEYKSYTPLHASTFLNNARWNDQTYKEFEQSEMPIDPEERQTIEIDGKKYPLEDIIVRDPTDEDII